MKRSNMMIASLLGALVVGANGCTDPSQPGDSDPSDGIVPVVGVSGLQALALATGADNVIACLDARMGEIYHAAYQREGDDYVLLGNISVCHPDTAPLVTGSGWVGCGSGFKAYPEVLAVHYGDVLERVDVTAYPHAQDIATLAVQQFVRGLGVTPEFSAPLYIRNKVALKICER